MTIYILCLFVFVFVFCFFFVNQKSIQDDHHRKKV